MAEPPNPPAERTDISEPEVLRWALHKEPGPGLVDGGTNPDPAVGLRAVAALRRLVERLEDLQVRNARDRGWSWAEIAAAIGVSKQAVHKKHASRMPDADRRS
jgi:hypothetical protein